MEVLFCRENLRIMGPEAFQALLASQGEKIRIQEVKCIIACGDCAVKYIARVDGELLATDTPEELVAQILALAAAS